MRTTRGYDWSHGESLPDGGVGRQCGANCLGSFVWVCSNANWLTAAGQLGPEWTRERASELDGRVRGNVGCGCAEEERDGHFTFVHCLAFNRRLVAVESDSYHEANGRLVGAAAEFSRAHHH